MPLQKDLREFIECLNSNKVEYLIVGALAVSWHGFARVSGMLDDLPVQFIGRRELIRNKEATGRPKDKIDAEQLGKKDN